MSDTVQTRDTPVIRLHPADNVAIAVRRLPTGAAVANDVAAREPISVRTQSCRRADCRGRSGAEIRAGDRGGDAAHPRGRPCACPQSGDVAIARRTRVARRQAPQRAAAQLLRVSAPERARGRTQLYRRPHQRELFGDRGAPHRRSGGENRLLDGYQNVDGVVAITHTSGCGMAGEGEGFELLRRTLWGRRPVRISARSFWLDWAARCCRSTA